MLSEIALRVVLWLLFIWLDHLEAFKREIKENELWKYQYPATPSIVPATRLWAFVTLAPIIFFSIEYMFIKNQEDVINGCLGITLSYCLSGCISAYIKLIVGRPRPDFFFRCFPDGKGSDLKHCVGSVDLYKDGRKSFPSGHATFAFSCMTFISLYLGRRLELFQEQRRRQSWQLCVCILPLFIASGIAISRTCDYHHHYEGISSLNVNYKRIKRCYCRCCSWKLIRSYMCIPRLQGILSKR